MFSKFPGYLHSVVQAPASFSQPMILLPLADYLRGGTTPMFELLPPPYDQGPYAMAMPNVAGYPGGPFSGTTPGPIPDPIHGPVPDPTPDGSIRWEIVGMSHREPVPAGATICICPVAQDPYALEYFAVDRLSAPHFVIEQLAANFVRVEGFPRPASDFVAFQPIKAKLVTVGGCHVLKIRNTSSEPQLFGAVGLARSLHRPSFPLLGDPRISGQAPFEVRLSGDIHDPALRFVSPILFEATGLRVDATTADAYWMKDVQIGARSQTHTQDVLIPLSPFLSPTPPIGFDRMPSGQMMTISVEAVRTPTGPCQLTVTGHGSVPKGFDFELWNEVTSLPSVPRNGG